MRSSHSFSFPDIRASVQRPRSLKPKNSTSSLPRASCSSGSVGLDRAVPAAVPDDDRAGAVVAWRDHALEVGVLDRVVLDVDGQALLFRAHRRPLRHRPALEHPVHLEAQVVVEAPRRVLLDDEQSAARPGGARRTAPACAPGRASSGTSSSCERTLIDHKPWSSLFRRPPNPCGFTGDLEHSRRFVVWCKVSRLYRAGGLSRCLRIRIGSGTISFGLVSIPVKLYTAASSAGGVSFNLLHAKCGSRIKQQTFCPVCNEVVDRSGLVKGYEFAKDQYVRFTDEELKSLEGEASKVIDIAEFVPLPQGGPDLLREDLLPRARTRAARRPTASSPTPWPRPNRVALAKFVMRGKESLVLIRPAQGGLMLHTMYFADEVRDFGEIDKGEGAKIKEGELDLALRLIDELSHDEFKPEQYQDEYRQRVLDLVNQKVEGKEVTAVGPQVQRAQVIDLMDALKQSLAKRVPKEKKPAARVERRATAPPRKAQTAKK